MCVCVITREGQEREFHTEKYSQVKPLKLHVNLAISNPPFVFWFISAAHKCRHFWRANGFVSCFPERGKYSTAFH